MTFEELVQDFKTDYELKELKSWWRAKISVDHLSDHFEGAKVVNITTSAVKEFIRARKTEGASNAKIMFVDID